MRINMRKISSLSVIFSLAFICTSCSQHTEIKPYFEPNEEIKETKTAPVKKDKVFKEKVNKIEIINQLQYPLDVVNLTDPLLLIKAMAQIDNQIKHCHYGKKKNSILLDEKEHVAQVFLKPSRFDFERHELDLFVQKESQAEMLTFTQNQCFDKDKSYQEMKAKSDESYGPVQDFVDNARDPKRI